MWGVQCWNSLKLLGILNLAVMRACGHAHRLAYDGQTKKHGHTLSIDTPAGSQFFDAARDVQYRRNLIGATYLDIVR